MSQALAAVDLGATSGRVVVGRIENGALEIAEAHRFANNPVLLPDGLHWDIKEIYSQILIGLRKADRAAGPLLSVGIDSWGVDYGLVDADGGLVGVPYHYRDERTARGVEAVHEKVPQVALYARTGLQFLPFNTIYQLAADQASGSLSEAKSVLLMPDLLGFWLTGARWAEATNASTTGLVDVGASSWATDLISTLGFDRGLFPPIAEPGQIVGDVLADVAADAGLGGSPLLTLVGSHDTASAVVGVPAEDPQFAYISCGTWALVGLELDSPVVSEAAREAGFTNEGGIDGTTRFLHNVMGLWLVEECLRHWQGVGAPVELLAILEAAAALPATGPTVDPNEPLLFSPGDMPARIQALCRDSGQAVPTDPPQVVRCIIDSLAMAFARTLGEAKRLSGREVKVLHVVGGGARNALLCQLTADATGVPVLAGPAEAAAIGNLLVQARAHFLIDGSLGNLRAIIRTTQPIRRFEPANNAVAAV